MMPAHWRLVAAARRSTGRGSRNAAGTDRSGAPHFPAAASPSCQSSGHAPAAEPGRAMTRVGPHGGPGERPTVRPAMEARGMDKCVRSRRRLPATHAAATTPDGCATPDGRRRGHSCRRLNPVRGQSAAAATDRGPAGHRSRCCPWRAYSHGHRWPDAGSRHRLSTVNISWGVEKLLSTEPLLSHCSDCPPTGPQRS